MIREVFVDGKPYLVGDDGTMLPPVMGGQWGKYKDPYYGAGTAPGRPPPSKGTGYYSTTDRSHELTEDELWNSSLVIGSDGFVYQVGTEVDPYSPQGDEYLTFGLAPKWVTEQVLGTGGDAAGGAGAATGPSAAELAIEQSGVQAANMANYLDAVIRGVETEIDAGRLSLEQAEAEFNRRMDALGEAGAQMEGMWKWTVPKDAGLLHPDIRADLDMEPWESQPITWDPYALAQQIIAETPGLTGPPVPTDPIQEAIEMAQGLV